MSKGLFTRQIFIQQYLHGSRCLDAEETEVTKISMTLLCTDSVY
jgi:hypothetical protein